MKKTVVAALAAVLCASASMADLISIVGDKKDNYVFSSGSVNANAGGAVARVGNPQFTAGASTNMSYVIPFLLPTLTGGSTITGATLSVFVTNNVVYATNMIRMDIRGGRTETTATVLSTDWNYGAVLANDVLNICTNRLLGLNPPTTNTLYTFVLNKSFFQNLYDTGNAGKFVFITLMADGVNDKISGGLAINNYLNIETADFPIAENRPTLNLYTIPEPATITMLGLGALVTVLLRCKRRY